MAALIAVHLAAPREFGQAAICTNSSGASQWQQFWNLHIASLPLPTFLSAFRALLLTCWGAYAILLWAGARLPQGLPRITAIGVTVLLAVALFFPPTLSADVYLYAGYGRTQVLYHGNPYVLGSELLEQHHDGVVQALQASDTAPSWHFFWRTPSVYGPVWTLIEGATALPGKYISVNAQVLIFKLFGALCVLGCALVAKRFSKEAGTVHPTVAFAAMALNPALLLEGVAAAHNDAFVALGIIAFFLFTHLRRNGLAGICLGAVAGVKMLPFGLVPWGLAMIRLDGGHNRLRRAAVFVLAATAPFIVGYALYWHGLETFRATLSYLKETEHSSPLPSIILYVGLTVLVFLKKDTALPAWAITSIWLAIYTQDHKVPWYMCWPVATALCRLDPIMQRIALLISTIAIISMLHSYAML